MIPPIIPIKNEQPGICADCGGECCKWTPGVFHPDQLLKGVSDKYAHLKSLLDTGLYVLRRFEGVNKNEHGSQALEVISPSSHLTRGHRFDYDVFGTCSFWTTEGCTLDENARPQQCQRLIPRFPDECTYPEAYDFKSETIEPWRPYQGLIIDL